MKYLTVKEVALQMRVKPSVVYAMHRSGQLRGLKLRGRKKILFAENEVRDFFGLVCTKEQTDNTAPGGIDVGGKL